MKKIDPIFNRLQNELQAKGYRFERVDFNRPWGGFFVIEEDQAEAFIKEFYPNEKASNLTKGGKVSPKILVVLPHKRLSWQYHHRRSEVWKVIEGSTGVVKSDTDHQGEVIVLDIGSKEVLKQGERHRLVGLNEIGVLAEIWQHTDPNHPSDENDIVRLDDDYGR